MKIKYTKGNADMIIKKQVAANPCGNEVYKSIPVQTPSTITPAITIPSLLGNLSLKSFPWLLVNMPVFEYCTLLNKLMTYGTTVMAAIRTKELFICSPTKTVKVMLTKVIKFQKLSLLKREVIKLISLLKCYLRGMIVPCFVLKFKVLERFESLRLT